jgi:TP901 family phage tail tape measure protein
MAAIYGFTIQALDLFSAPIRSALGQMNAFAAAQRSAAVQMANYRSLTNNSANSIGDLRAAIALLHQEREIIPVGETERLRSVNQEIRRLENEVGRLSSLNGGALHNAISGLSNAVPGLAALSNPITAIAGALTASGNAAMQFEKGMAEVNATAQLSVPGLNLLNEQMKNLALEKGIDLNTVPAGLNKMISITNDVRLSMDAMSVAADISKAGFVTLDVAASTLAQTMGALGTKDANHVADVLFAIQREGAVTFSELASNFPRLIPVAKSLGFSMEELGGTFAYMTAKGLNAADTTTLISNLFTAFSKPEIRNGLRGIGIELTGTDGKIRSLTEVTGDLYGKLKTMSVDEQLNVMKGIGFTDAQARDAIRLLINDFSLFQEKVKEVTESQDALSQALGKVQNSSYDMQGAWSVMQVLMVNLGNAVLPPVVFILKGLAYAASYAAKYSWVFWDAVLALTGVLYGAQIQMGILNYATKIWGVVMQTGIFTTAKWTLANWSAALSLNGISTALKNIPIIGWLLAAIGLTITLIQNWDGFRYMLWGVLGVVKNIFELMWAIATLDFSNAANLIKMAYTGERNKHIKADEDAKNALYGPSTKLLQGLNLETMNGQNEQGNGSGESNSSMGADMNAVGDSVAGGGARATSITIENLNLLPNLVINTTQIKEGAERAADMMGNELMNVFRSVVVHTR